MAGRWSFRAPGSHRGCVVSVFAEVNGMLYGRESFAGTTKVSALGHGDRRIAEAWARQRLKELVAGQRVLQAAEPTIAKVVAAYLEARTPLKKSKNSRDQDARAGAMWEKFLGPKFDLALLGWDELDRFQMQRKAGAVDAWGEPVVPKLRRPVRVRAVGGDLEFLRAVCRWAHRLPRGRRLLNENPMEGYVIPKEANPRRPVASQDRYEKLLAVGAQVHPDFRDLFVLANETARRLSAVRALRPCDLELSVGPHGSIRWPGETDKEGAEWVQPLNAVGRATVDRVLARRKLIGKSKAPLFPSDTQRGEAVARDTVYRWLLKAEELAGVAHLDRGGMHAYRRKWGTERKHLPIQDVAQAGGWKSLDVLQRIYQQADPLMLQRVVDEPIRLREMQG